MSTAKNNETGTSYLFARFSKKYEVDLGLLLFVLFTKKNEEVIVSVKFPPTTKKKIKNVNDNHETSLDQIITSLH
jgi:hypothetical protein